jgi:hypothetical protein
MSDDKSITEANQVVAEKTPWIVDMSMGTLFGALVMGAIVGALVMGGGVLLEQYFVEPVFCQSADSFTLCANGGSLANNIATVLIGIVGAVGLVKLSVYRPLLVVIAAAATLWNANMWLGALPWFEALAWYAGLYAVAYVAFAWVLRLTNFIGAFVLMIALIVGARLMLQM